MRWGKKEIVIYATGATRMVERFLWLPTKLRVGWGHEEWRWFERVTIEQTWHNSYTDAEGRVFSGWIDNRFVNLEEEKARASRSTLSGPGERPLG